MLSLPACQFRTNDVCVAGPSENHQAAGCVSPVPPMAGAARCLERGVPGDNERGDGSSMRQSAAEYDLGAPRRNTTLGFDRNPQSLTPPKGKIGCP